MPHPIHQQQIKNPDDNKQLCALPKDFAAFAKEFFQGTGFEQLPANKG
jgi:hypothetical protein